MDIIQDAYERFKHLDHLLSDREWLGVDDPPDESDRNFQRQLRGMVLDFWAAIRTAATQPTQQGLDVKRITADWLKANGYDGLAGEVCGCGIGDLMPYCLYCFYPSACKPAYRHDGPCGDHTCYREGIEGIHWCTEPRKEAQ